MVFPNLFDLVAGALLDKRLLMEGVRVGSWRRIAASGMGVAVFYRAWTDPLFGWPHVVAITVVVLALDLQGAVRAAPEAALRAAGEAIGGAAGRIRSAYGYATSAWGYDTPTPHPPSHPEDPDETG